jgi:cell division protein FtsQ
MKKTIKRILFTIGLLILVLAVAITLAFSSKGTADIKCSQIVVKYAGHQMIRLSEKELIQLVRSSNQQIIGNRLDKINTEAIEKIVSKNGAILKADAYKTVVRDSTGLKGAITLKVRHRVPVLRVFSSQGSFYVDKLGSRIPVSVNYSADVPVATGNISTEMARTELVPFVDFIQHNKFWKAQIKQIHVNEAGELILTTLVGNQLIEFGTTENMEKKFRNLRAFYDQVLRDNNWKKYNRIILKFENQVVAKKS